MKKVFMSAAVIAMMICAASCGNNASKKAEADAAVEEAAETLEAVDSTVSAAADSVIAAANQVVETVAE